jgi:hypothetical protein
MKYTIQRQLTVAIENQPGRLAAISRALAQQGVNIKDISIIDNIEQGVIRLVTSNAVLGRSVLAKEGLYVVEADVLVVDLSDTPGRLAVLSQALADADVNIDYAYGSEDSSEQKMRIVMKVSNLAKACQVISTFKTG